MDKSITIKSTKLEILEAYKKAVQSLKSQESTKFNPTAQLQEQKKEKTIKTAESTSIKDLEVLTSDITEKVSAISDKLTIYKQILAAIEIKEQELKQMFDIEVGAYSLSALVNSQKDLTEKFECEMTKKKNELTQLVESTMKDIQTRKENAEREINEIKANAKKARKQEEETYCYDVTRARKIEEDIFNDKLIVKTKEYETKLLNLIERENHIKELEQTIEELKTEMSQAVKIATEQATTKAKTAYTFEITYLKKTTEGEINLLTNKIDTLTQNLQEVKSLNVTLSIKLDEAYTKLENLAKASIDGAGNKDLINTLTKALNEKGASGK